MSVRRAKDFLARVSTDQATTDRARDAHEAALLAVAQQQGFDISAEDLRAARRPPRRGAVAARVREGRGRSRRAVHGPRLPDFYILGAQKSGTTWLHAMLDQHPDVFLPHRKELHFFNRRRNYERGIDWYASHFDDAPHRAVVGEATPDYLWASDHRAAEWSGRQHDTSWNYCMPERIAAWSGPRIRFVVLLREPVARAVSGFFHHVRAGGHLDEDAPFLDNARTWGIAHMGFYAAHLARFREVFDPEQFLVLLFEEVMQQPAVSLDRVCDHLGIDRLRLPDRVLRERVHGGTKHRDGDGVYYFDEQHTKVAITPQDLEELRRVYEPENRRLEDLLDRDVSVWRSAEMTAVRP